MAKTPEGRVKAAVKKLFDEKKIWYYQPVQNGMGRVGIPDFICCYQGRFLAVETKAPGRVNDVTPNQHFVLQEIREHGGFSVVVDSVETLKEHLQAVAVMCKLED